MHERLRKRFSFLSDDKKKDDSSTASFVEDEYSAGETSDSSDAEYKQDRQEPHGAEIDEEMSVLLQSIKRRDTNYQLDGQEIDDDMDANGLAQSIKKRQTERTNDLEFVL
ncbi:hypothetical protein AC249_AIPGENE11010 [Exaiptasia diaphana]|nr:hypothetical protein AC249_AIPGENE11010 [Exaiptasia diaphana]